MSSSGTSAPCQSAVSCSCLAAFAYYSAFSSFLDPPIRSSRSRPASQNSHSFLDLTQVYFLRRLSFRRGLFRRLFRGLFRELNLRTSSTVLQPFSAFLSSRLSSAFSSRICGSKESGAKASSSFSFILLFPSLISLFSLRFLIIFKLDSSIYLSVRLALATPIRSAVRLAFEALICSTVRLALLMALYHLFFSPLESSLQFWGFASTVLTCSGVVLMVLNCFSLDVLQYYQKKLKNDE